MSSTKALAPVYLWRAELVTESGKYAVVSTCPVDAWEGAYWLAGLPKDVWANRSVKKQARHGRRKNVKQ